MSDPHDPLADQRIRTACLVILTVIAVGMALIPLRPVLVPLLLALLFTYCLKPLIDVQVRRLHWPRPVAVGGALLIGLAMLATSGLVIITFIAELQANLPVYQVRFRQLSREVAAAVPLYRLGLPVDPEGSLTVPDDAVRGLLASVVSSATDVVSGGGLVLLFVLFLLLGSPSQPRRKGSLMAEIEARAQRYILQMVGFSALTGFLVGLSLGVVGVDFPFAFGFMAFLFNFIPTIGPLVATLLPLPVVLLAPDLSPAAKVMAFVLPTAVQLTFAVIQPRVQGGGQNLHPVTTLAALVFFGSIWGILGAALAVPLTGVIRIILERIPTTRPVAGWMAGDFDVVVEADSVEVRRVGHDADGGLDG